MRTPAALSATLAWLALTPLASAQTPAHSDTQPSSAPEPSHATATTETASPAVAADATTATKPASPGLVITPAEPDQPLFEAIPNARDTLGGHFVIGASAGVKWPFGSHSSALGTGYGLNLDLGFGLGRSVVLGAWGEFDAYAGASGCSACSGKSFAGGPFLRYHLVQGTRFDPWGSLAVGVRQTSVDNGVSTAHYFGPELLKLSLGGDWYPTSNIGFGPYVTIDVGSYNESTAHAGLGAGLRLIVDLPGK